MKLSPRQLKLNALSLPEVHYNLIFISSLGQTITERKGRWEQARETAYGSAGQQVRLDPQTLCYPHLPHWKQLYLRFLSLYHTPVHP